MADIVVIGGGAAGMAAALFAARAGASVLLLEKNEKLGKKVYITGKGRCNLTNDCDTDEFMAQVPRNPRFLYSALNFFSPQDMMSLLESAGCPVQVQRGRRVFPVSEKASDVTRALFLKKPVMSRGRCSPACGMPALRSGWVQEFSPWSQRAAGSPASAWKMVPWFPPGRSLSAPAASATRLPVPPGTDTVLRKKRAIQWSPGLRSWSVWR